MIDRGARIRDIVIPDIQVKMLELCLEDGENGILSSITRRFDSDLDNSYDSVFKEIVTERLNSKSVLPIALRKKQLYEKVINEIKLEEQKQKFEKILLSENLPIMMRKHLLCKEVRAG